MKTSSKRTIVSLALLLIVLGIVPSAPAQVPTSSATTEIHDSTWNSSMRVTQTRVEARGRTVETQVLEAPSINGGYALVTATEEETIQDGPGALRMIERRYVPDADGHRQLSRIMEATTTTVGGNKTTVRIMYASDLDGYLHAIERETEESVTLNASTVQTVTTRFLVRAGEFAPVQQTVTIETRKENGVADVQRTISFPDASGRFIAASITHTDEQISNGVRVKNERVLQPDAGMATGEGQMSSTLRTITREWKDSSSEEHSLAETHLMFTAGVAPDGHLHMYRQVATAREVMANGDTQVVQETADVNPGVRSDVPQPRAKVIEITHVGADGHFETRTVTEAPTSSGSMRPFCVSSTQGVKSNNR